MLTAAIIAVIVLVAICLVIVIYFLFFDRRDPWRDGWSRQQAEYEAGLEKVADSDREGIVRVWYGPEKPRPSDLLPDDHPSKTQPAVNDDGHPRLLPADWAETTISNLMAKHFPEGIGTSEPS